MNPKSLKVAFLIGLADRKTPQEKGLLFFRMVALPLVYVFTPWLAIANYHLPIWANGLGVVTFAIASRLG